MGAMAVKHPQIVKFYGSNMPGESATVGGLHLLPEEATSLGLYSHVDSYVDTVSKLSYICVHLCLICRQCHTSFASVLVAAQDGLGEICQYLCYSPSREGGKLKL